MDNSGVPTFSDNTAGHDLALDFGITADGHAAGHILGIGAQHGARVGTIGQTAADDGGAEIDAADDIKSAVGRGKGTAGDVHGSSTVVGDRNRTVPAVVVGHTAAHHGGIGGAAIDGNAGTFGGGCKGIATGRLGVVAAHDQFVVVSVALTKRTILDSQGRLAGLQLGTGSAGDLAAAHHELGGSGLSGSGLTADGGGDIAVLYGKETLSVSRQAFGVAAADDLVDVTASDGEGDGARMLWSGLGTRHQPAAHEVVGAYCGVVFRFRRTVFQRHVIRSSHSHTGAAHDQHAGHSQAAESVHQVALFEHRLVPVDEIPDGSLGKLHNSISRICDVRPTTGVRCTGRLSGRETKNRCN